MKKIIILILAITLLSGCQKNNEYELIFDMGMNCYGKVYEFDNGTKIYSSYSIIKYKTDDIEIPINEALDKGLVKLSDLKNNENFKIVNPNEDCIFCSN